MSIEMNGRAGNINLTALDHGPSPPARPPVESERSEGRPPPKKWYRNPEIYTLILTIGSVILAVLQVVAAWQISAVAGQLAINASTATTATGEMIEHIKSV